MQSLRPLELQKCVEQDSKLRKMWNEPDWADFKVRAKGYLQSHVKENSESPLFELVWFETFSGKHDDLLHISQSKKSFVQKAAGKFGNDVPQLFVVTLLIPGSPLVACVQYFARKLEVDAGARVHREGEALWERFLRGDDTFRKSRLKLIPGVPEGPWVVKKSVSGKPVILSHGLEVYYFQGPTYLEAVVDVSSDRIAKNVTSLCRSHSTSLKANMGYVVEGLSDAELPEVLLGCVQSARHAKRLGQLSAPSRASDGSESESDGSSLEEKRPAGFAFLADDSDESDSDESDSNESNSKEEEAQEEQQRAPQPPAPVATSNSNKKNKKSGAARKGGKADADNEEDVDDILDALAAQAGGVRVTAQRNASESALFSVQLGFINADKEMKRIFGTTRKVQIVTPLDEWPRPPTFVGGGIRWTRANKPAGPGWSSACHYFEVTWSIAYKKAHEEFELVQRTHDPNIMGHFLQRYPYHIDALLQMSEVFQHHGQMDHAADCIKRCMYALELAWADQFDVARGECRMDISTEHNAGFFRALFLLMKQVGRRGCMRSAFETAKLLLGLDPLGDPMHVLLAVDYYALTSRQCQFILDLHAAAQEAVDRFPPADAGSAPKKSPGVVKAGTTRSDKAASVSALPNLQFSLALAHFFMGNADAAKEQLAKALLQFPSVLKPLLEKISANTSSATWKPVLASRVFANAKALADDGLIAHLLSIYVTRNHTLWKVNDVQNLLLRAAQHALATPTLFTATPQVTALHASLHKYQRAVANDYSDEVTTLPPDHPMMQPPELLNGQPMDAEALAALAQVHEQVAAGNLPADANPLLLFLQTLLPWNHVAGAGPPANADADADAPQPNPQ
ncbi:hypothetical protein PybrP1_000501 [[Pythium] brassicae (nom. inval.)]|nr:hypothetical protein PybrP1_000501 [[Pythium] brassicae (nom. inval.)]